MHHDHGGDLHLPTGAATGAAVVLHPHPSMGGDRHHPLVVAVADALAEAGVAALRLDVRDPDVRAAALVVQESLATLATEVGAPRRVLVGYSWGAAVAAQATLSDLSARVLVAPPVTMLELAPLAEPTLLLVPAHDQYGPPAAVEATVADWPHATVEVVEGCDHFLVGAVARIASRAVEWISAQG